MSWDTFTKNTLWFENSAFGLDVSKMDFEESQLAEKTPEIKKALQAMADLEKGAIANPDENRQVGHYWLRDPELAPDAKTTQSIKETLEHIHLITKKVHSGELSGEKGPFTHLLVVGIGGSALGPEFVHRALGQPGSDKLEVHFFDNTDPEGMDLTLSQLRGKLGQTLTIVISKSGGTPETRNGMLEAEHAYRESGLNFAKHAIAITGEGSKLDNHAKEQGWVARLPMWDWVGGRTSELGPVGLLPAALQGIAIDEMLAGAKEMDALTRESNYRQNPAMMMALTWYFATDGKGQKDMVILPYKDRLELFSRYLQQLVMESLGKEKDLDGKTVHQGISVYGNKGSTDQHAYVQQLRDGVPNFYAVFIQVLEGREGESIAVEDEHTCADFLQGFLLGTRAALHEKGRSSMTITIRKVTPKSVGQLIALFERAVGFYGSLVNINAYHQPGVEAGKKAAASILKLKAQAHTHLRDHSQQAFTAQSLADALGEKDSAETLFWLLESLAANPQKGVSRTSKTPFYANEYQFSTSS